MWKDNENIIEVYNRLDEGKTGFPCKCPNCKRQSVHIYFHKYKENRCGIWVWCSKCGAFAHMSGYAPNWWKNPDFIDENELCADPRYLELKAKDIDNWVNSLAPTASIENHDTFIEDRFNAKLKIDIQGIPAGTEGVLVVKNNLKTTSVRFICKTGKIVELFLSREELLQAVEIL